MTFKEKIYNYLSGEIKERRVFIHPPYPGELLISFAFREKTPIILLTEEEPLKVKKDAEFFFDKIDVLNSDNTGKVGALLDSGNLDILIMDEKALELEIPEQESIKVSVGKELPTEEFIYLLEEGGLRSSNRVYETGEYVRRGGIIDVWTGNNELPVRIELFGEEVDSIRVFNPSSQLSEEKIGNATFLVSKGKTRSITDVTEKFFKIGPEIDDFKPDIKFYPTGESIPFTPAPTFRRNLEHFRSELREHSSYDIYLAVETPGEISRMKELFADEFPDLMYIDHFLTRGFILDEIEIAVYAESDIFGLLRARRRETRKKILQDERKVFNKDDLVVHEDFGIGRFKGLEKIEIDRKKMECLAVKYRGKSRVLIPVEKSNLLTQYISGGEREPKLSDLSQKKWERRKKRVKKELREYAEELLSLYAKRESSEGYSFSKNDSMMRELELSFPFRETEDQESAILEVYRDMEKEEPMDRLLCGEVGFGKTEIAVRAAFKSVLDSKQVAVLAPTTILSEQHYRTFRERLKKFPVNIELLSRFTEDRQDEIMKKVEEGKCDILIGTHKLLSSSLSFNDLGLLIIDEEQRFGVKQKEKLKELRIDVDVLSMSATPIPRTLQFSLLGIRNLSVIQTPPEGRKGVITRVEHWKDDVIRDAILKEVERGGQVFFVHNRIKSIQTIKEKLKRIVPEIDIIIGHGQLSNEALENRMTDFLEHKYDLLLCTSIIESGLDMSNVNTIIIDNAENFGLADLHQLRGRVGRSERQGFCYLLVSEDIEGKAKDRISAVKTYSELGSGFKISLKDLEIRGAGEILGEKQHGHISRVGYELYIKMLNEAIKEAKGEKVEKRKDIEVSLSGSFLIPESYIPQQEERIVMYRRISATEEQEDVNHIETEMKDRFGPLPDEVKRILKWARLRILARKGGIQKIEEGIRHYTCRFEEELQNDTVRNLISKFENLRFSYGEKLTVQVPRKSIFSFLEELRE